MPLKELKKRLKAKQLDQLMGISFASKDQRMHNVLFNKILYIYQARLIKKKIVTNQLSMAGRR